MTGDPGSQELTIDITEIEFVRKQDSRDVMGWWSRYRRTDAATCSIGACRDTTPPHYVIKQVHARFPKGWLFTRCQDHQDRWETSHDIQTLEVPS